MNKTPRSEIDHGYNYEEMEQSVIYETSFLLS